MSGKWKRRRKKERKAKTKKKKMEKKRGDEEGGDLDETLRDINTDETSAVSTTGHKCTHTHDTLIQNTHANSDDKKDKSLGQFFYYGLQQSANPCLFLFSLSWFFVIVVVAVFFFLLLTVYPVFFSDVSCLSLCLRR